MCEEYDLSDFNGDVEAFMDACYQAYLTFWDSNPHFQEKRIQRNKNEISGKEKDFWGIVEGHSDGEIDLLRYKKVPILSYLLNPENINANEDVLFFKRIHNRKIRIEIFSISKQYLIVLQEIGNHPRAQFITAFPLGNKQLLKKKKQHQEYIDNEEKPI